MPSPGRTPFPLILLLSLAASGALAERSVVQPVENRSGVHLTVDGERAWVVTRDDRTVRLPLRRGERPTALVETRDGWVAAGMRQRAQGRSLFALRRGPDGRLERLPPTGRPRPLYQLAPVPLVDNGRFAGLAWLEGAEPRRLEVRAAVWAEDGWGPVETVAEPGAGSQTGLAGAVLADGSWLLAWAAYDGRDDEILWSLRHADGWTRPRRLHRGNSVPDVTPALIAQEGGAIASWGRVIDDEFRVLVARFDGAVWHPEQLTGAPGTLYPSFVRLEVEPLLLIRAAAPAGWTVVALDGDAEVTRRAGAALPSPVRPLVEGARDGGLALRWPEQDEGRVLGWEPPR